jgi:hypothetical protein
MIMYGVAVALLVVVAVTAMVAWRHTRAGRVCADPTSTVTRAELAIITAYCPGKLSGAVQ